MSLGRARGSEVLRLKKSLNIPVQGIGDLGTRVNCIKKCAACSELQLRIREKQKKKKKKSQRTKLGAQFDYRIYFSV